MKRFKKIYIEITNSCNLNCSFCSVSNKEKREMTIDEFTIVIDKIKDYTDYVYLHVKGEPLLHSSLNEILSLCDRNNLFVNVTTNGTLLKERFEILNNHNCIRQLNISLHSENNKKTYFEDIFETCKLLSTKMFISYRLWTLKDFKLDEKTAIIVEKIINSYNLSTDGVEKLKKDKAVKINKNTFVNKSNLFEWPSMNNNNDSDGYCYGFIDQVAILSDGTVTACCLDSDGILNSGNIISDSFDEIINSKHVNVIIDGFKNRNIKEKLCRKCTFKNRF